MRTRVAATEPPDRPEIGPTVTTAGATTTTADVVLSIVESMGLTMTQWQTVVIHGAYSAGARNYFSRHVRY